MAHKQSDTSEARRRFLAQCGKFAVVTPPTVGLLLAAAKQNYAVASSGGRGWGGKGDHDQGGNGWGNQGNGGGDRGNHGDH
jgi:hypothetical protein